MNILPAIALSVVLGGCSVGMALSGKKDPDLSVIKRGEHREVIELQLGPPREVAFSGEDTLAVYEYEIGNEPSSGRAAFHGVMDVLTFCAWEVIGTPVEAVDGTMYKITITYDKNNCVKSIKK